MSSVDPHPALTSCSVKPKSSRVDQVPGDVWGVKKVKGRRKYISNLNRWCRGNGKEGLALGNARGFRFAGQDASAALSLYLDPDLSLSEMANVEAWRGSCTCALEQDWQTRYFWIFNWWMKGVASRLLTHQDSCRKDVLLFDRFTSPMLAATLAPMSAWSRRRLWVHWCAVSPKMKEFSHWAWVQHWLRGSSHLTPPRRKAIIEADELKGLWIWSIWFFGMSVVGAVTVQELALSWMFETWKGTPRDSAFRWLWVDSLRRSAGYNLCSVYKHGTCLTTKSCGLSLKDGKKPGVPFPLLSRSIPECSDEALLNGDGMPFAQNLGV